jgi:hypothetical protein
MNHFVSCHVFNAFAPHQISSRLTLLFLLQSRVILVQNFLRDLLKEAKRSNDVSENKLIEYTDIMVSLVSHLVRLVRFRAAVKLIDDLMNAGDCLPINHVDFSNM